MLRGLGQRSCTVGQRLQRAKPWRQGPGYGLAERPLVVAGEETHLLEPVRRKFRRVGKYARNGSQPRSRNRARNPDFQHDADALAGAKRDSHAVAWDGLPRRVAQIIEKFCDRNVQCDP